MNKMAAASSAAILLIAPSFFDWIHHYTVKQDSRSPPFRFNRLYISKKAIFVQTNF
jgi:hypothetical protein